MVAFGRIRVSLAAAVLLVCAGAASGQDLAAPIALDPQVRTGVLPNGFTFFILPTRVPASAGNPSPERRLTLRLAVKAGSADEADDQRGLAHMLEHMAFNGSRNFKPGELVQYFASVGARLGPHVNAATTYDTTTYTLDVLINQDGVLGRAFAAMRDFAGGITLDPEEIDRERGVVIEEWRGRLGASSRLQAPRLAALFGSSLYAARLPIGDPVGLQTFERQRLRDFYTEHYRADRMALIVVGDIVPAAGEALIRELFSDLPRSTGRRRAPHEIPSHSGTQYVALSDAEDQGASVAVIYKRPAERRGTRGGFRAGLQRALVLRMTSARLAEMSARPDAPFVGAAASSQPLAGGIDALTIGAFVRDGRVEIGLGALTQEIERVLRHGFTDVELDRARKEVLAGYERVRIDSSALAVRLQQHYLAGEPMPGPRSELVMARAFLTEFTAAEVSGAARELFADVNRVVIATAPDRVGRAAITEDLLRETVRASGAAVLEPWRSTAAAPATPPARPVAGAVRGRREIPEIGVTVLTLSNGVEVWLKPTDFNVGEVAFSAYARGGASLAAPDDFVGALMSGLLIASAGVGGLTPEARNAQLAGRLVRVAPTMLALTHGVSGSARSADLETALQLVNLYFTAPNLDAASLERGRRVYETSLASQAQNPLLAFRARVGRVNSMGHYSRSVPAAADVAAIDPGRVAAYYRQRFANAADFTFFFVGAFTVESITPLLTTYVASLPSNGSVAAREVPLRPQFPSGIVRETLTMGREPRSQTAVTFFADTGLDEARTNTVKAAAAILQARLMKTLREELGATYTINVQYADSAPEPGYGTVSVEFGSAPENADRLAAALMSELDRLRRDGPAAEDVEAVKAAGGRALQAALRQNAYWAGSLQASHVLERDPRGIPRQVELVNALNAESLREAFKEYFPTDRYTVVTLMPEAK